MRADENYTTPHIVPIALLEHLRALKLTLFEHFRVLKCSNRGVILRALKYSNRVGFRDLKCSNRATGSTETNEDNKGSLDSGALR